MFRRWQLWLGVPALALSALLFATTPASAQRFFGRGGNNGGWGMNYSPSTGLSFGNNGYYNNGYYGSGYYGNGYYGNGWNNGWGNGYYGSGWNNGYYGSNSYSPWNTGYNSWYTPRSYAYDYYPGDYYSNSGYYSDYEPNYYYSQTPYYQQGFQQQGYTSFYNQNQNIPRDAALVRVHIPANADLWFSGEKTHQKGNMRLFETPEMKQDKDYFYDLKARWTDQDGKTIERTRRVTIHPGAHVMVDFMRNDQADQGTRRDVNERNTNTDRTNPPADRSTAPANTNPAPRNDKNRNDQSVP